MLNLGQIGVGIAVVYQGIEKVRGLPDGLDALVQREVLSLFGQHVGQGLALVVEAVKLGHPW